MLDLDSFDLALLDALQKEGRATHHQLAEHVALSASQIGRRLQRLEAAGVIEGYRVVLRPEALGLAVTAFTTLRLQHHGDQVIERFHRVAVTIDYGNRYTGFRGVLAIGNFDLILINGNTNNNNYVVFCFHGFLIY